ALIEGVRPGDGRGDPAGTPVDHPRLPARLDEERRERPRRLAEPPPPGGEEAADGGVRLGGGVDAVRSYHRQRDRARVEVLRAGTRPAPKGPGSVRGPDVP